MSEELSLLGKFEIALRRMAARTVALEEIADWKEELRRRIWRAQARFEVSGLPPDELFELEYDVREFVRVCEGIRRFGWREHDAEEGLASVGNARQDHGRKALDEFAKGDEGDGREAEDRDRGRSPAPA